MIRTTSRNVFLLTILLALGFFFWIFLYQIFINTKAELPKIKTTFGQTKIDVAAGGTFKVNVFMSGKPTDKISGVTALLNYPSDLIEYISTLKEPSPTDDQTEKTCVTNGYKLKEVLNEKTEGQGHLIITRVAIEKDENLPSGTFCLGTITFKSKAPLKTSTAALITFTKLDKWEIVGPLGSYQPETDTINSQLEVSLIP